MYAYVVWFLIYLQTCGFFKVGTLRTRRRNIRTKIFLMIRQLGGKLRKYGYPYIAIYVLQIQGSTKSFAFLTVVEGWRSQFPDMCVFFSVQHHVLTCGKHGYFALPERNIEVSLEASGKLTVVSPIVHHPIGLKRDDLQKCHVCSLLEVPLLFWVFPPVVDHFPNGFSKMGFPWV